jgi:UDP-N-acetylmuramoyl-L-alanyl-D-glutamate--2,6-diaminopimelate ligase
MVILTSDNPAGEEAGAIIEDIRRGMSTDPLIIPDRREAVFHALSTAAPGDLVLLAGKGAEEYQIIGERAVPYSDRQAVADYLAEKGFGGG